MTDEHMTDEEPANTTDMHQLSDLRNFDSEDTIQCMNESRGEVLDPLRTPGPTLPDTQDNNNNGLTRILNGLWQESVSGEWPGTPDDPASDSEDTGYDSSINMSEADSDEESEHPEVDGETSTNAEIQGESTVVDTSRDIVVTIRKPQSGSMCPISLDTVENSVVDGFEGFVVNPDSPEMTEIVLPCQHCFSACFLLVSWLTTQMRCPLCRSGIDTTLSPLSMPEQWQQPAIDHIQRIVGNDRTQQLSDDHEEALRIGLDYTTNIQLYMCIYIIDRSGSVQSTVVQFSQNMSTFSEISSDVLTLTVTRAHVRQISGLIRHQDCVAVDMVVFARCEGIGVELVEVANSGIFDMPTRMDDGSEPPPIVQPHPVRNFVTNKQSIQRDNSSPNPSENIFSMVWQQFPNRMMDTMTDITFSIPFINLAMTVGGLFVGPGN